MIDRTLPSFRNPPVTEVVVGIAFEPVPGLSGPVIGQLWAEEFHDFTRAEEHPRYDPAVERFDQVGSALKIDFSIGTDFPRPRIWLVNDAEDELVQIQDDYFACNWRKVGRDAPYGRWSERRAAFDRSFNAFESFVVRRSLATLTPTQCEVTYVNHIDAKNGVSGLSDAPSLFRLFGKPPYGEEGFSGSLEQMQLTSTYLLTADGRPCGRLHVEIQPGHRLADRSPVYQMKLTARGRPFPGKEGVMTFLDQGRHAIVTAFASMTTPAMHELWGRYS